MANYRLPMMPNEFYHVYNRAVGSEKAFITDDNYLYFLRLLRKHVTPVADIFAYCLLPNHYHLLVRIKNENTIAEYHKNSKGKPFDIINDKYSDVAIKSFSNHLNAYTKAFNKMFSRMGNLFMPNFQRSEADVERDVTSFIFYVHKNPVHHGLTKTIGEWKYDSYNTILSENPTALARNEVIDWFGSRNSFISFHQQPVGLKIKGLKEV